MMLQIPTAQMENQHEDIADAVEQEMIDFRTSLQDEEDKARL